MIAAPAPRTRSVLASLFVSLVLLSAHGGATMAPPDESSVPEPPRTYLDTTYELPTSGTVYNVSSAALLQTVLDAAHPGDVIVLQAGTTFTGHFVLRNQAGSGWIYVVSSALASLPPSGTRVTPAVAGFMPKIVTTDNLPAIATEPGAHHYRFVGVEIASSLAVTTSTTFSAIALGTDSAPSVDQQPHHITFDRCYVHGTPTGNLRRGITMNSASTAIVDSYFDEVHETFGDSQAVGSWNGPGPFKLVNNYFSASGENVMFGGSDPSILDLVPSDIEIRGNYFSKQLVWKWNDPSFAGIPWIVKNLLELKNAQRVLVQGNVFENNWEAAQRGFAVVLTPRNQGGFSPWSVVQDVAFLQNIVRHSGAGLTVLGTDNDHPSQRTARILIRDNLFTDILNDDWGPGWAFGINLTAPTGPAVGADYLTIDHNTLLPDVAPAFADRGDDPGARQEHFVFTNNLAQHQFMGSGFIEFGAVLDHYFDAPVFTKNAFIGTTLLPAYPGNFFPASVGTVGFVNAAGGDYTLAAASPFKNAGSDGRDLGADITGLNAAVACALTATCSVTAPLIGGSVQASGVTSSAATITWTTNQVSDSQVEYGLTTAYGNTTSVDSSLVLTHAQTLTGLAAITTYHYRVKSRNSGGLAVSGDFTFTTAHPVPVVSGLNASAVTATSAVIGWTTDQPANSQVEYGVTTAYGSVTPIDPALVLTHAQSVTGLTGATTYHYRVKSRNGDGVLGTSADATFTTPPVPVVTNLTISNIQGASVAITWMTDQAADTQVEYGLTTNYGSLSTLNATLSTGHGQAISGLIPGTLYHLRARSRNSLGYLGTSADTTFTTAPAPVISAVGTSSLTGTSVVISWTTDLPSNTRIEYGPTASLGSQTPLDSAFVTAHSQTISGLTPGVTYFFLVRSTTAQNALSKLGGFTFTTMLPPVIGGVGSSGLTSTGATINWSTNQGADSQIEYGTTTAYGSTTTLDPALVTTHVQVLSGLTPQTTYHYRVKSQNGGGLSTSGDFSFTTFAPPPVISNIIVSPITATTATVTWQTDLPSSSWVDYGPTTAYDKSAQIGSPLVTNHAVILRDLLPGTTYHYRVMSATSTSSTWTGDFTFTTEAPPPVISNVAASVITATTATIGWTTDRASTSQVEYHPNGAAILYGSSTALDPTLTMAHSQGLTGLTPNTTYHYRVKSGSSGGLTTSGDFTFTTVIPPPTITNVLASAITTTSASIGWTTDWGSDSQVEYGPTTAYGSVTAIDSTPTATHSQSISGLSTGTTYHFRVKSRTNGGLTTSGDFTFTTLVPAPVLSNVVASGITASSATIGWSTNNASSSQVEYGLTTAYGNTTTLDANPVFTHSQPLAGLLSGTLYHYRVISTTNGGTTTSADFTLTTLNGAPVLSSIGASSITTSSASIGWTTDLAATSQVEYGLTTAYGSTTAFDATQAFTHSQLLTGLTGATTYHFRVRSSTNGGTTTSGDFTFTTIEPAPVLSNIASSGITGTGATITWTTDRASDSQVDYGTTTAYGSSTTLNPALVTAHSQALTGLTPGTIYHYRVKSRTAGGLTVSGDGVFTTTPLPPAISNVVVSGLTNTTALIGWTTDQPADSQIEYGLTLAYGSTTTLDPALVTSHSQALSGLSAGTTYHYRVKSRNSAGMLSESADFTFTTTTAPVVTNVTVSNVQGASVAVTWMTNQAADTQIEYGLTTSYGSMTTLNTTLSTGHGQAINTGLNPGTTYHYRVRSRNAAGLLGTSEDLTFSTAPAPVISNVGTNAAGTSVVVTWTTDLPSNSKIEYGTTAALGSQTTLDPALVTSHSHTIGGLTPGTTYFFLVRSITAQNALAKLGGFTVTTLSAPVVSGVNASAVTGAMATISWTTNVPSDSRVEYGTTTAYGNTTTVDPAPVTAHSQGLTGLLPLTTYHYRVRSQNSAGATTSADFTFTTTDPLPIISSVTASGITTSSAFVSWSTDRLADSQIEYGLTTAYGAVTALDPATVLSHGQTLSGLAGGTTYHYRVRSANGNGVTVSADATFRTLFPPPVFFNVTASAITATAATINWTTDQASTSQVEYGLTTAYGSTTGLNASLATSHSMGLSNLTASTTYHYRVLSRNPDGQLGTSADGVFTTRPLPVVSNVTISNITGSTAAVTWMTDVPADTQIEFGLTTNYGQMTPLNAALVTGHGQAISGLLVGTTYQMRVRSRNAGGDLGVSANFTFTTAAAPVISNVAVTQLTPTSVVVTWTTDLASNSKIEYGFTTSYGQQTTLDPALVTSHSHTISGLTPGTTYFFLVRSTTAQNALSKLGGFTFTTPPQ